MGRSGYRVGACLRAGVLLGPRALRKGRLPGWGTLGRFLVIKLGREKVSTHRKVKVTRQCRHLVRNGSWAPSSGRPRRRGPGRRGSGRASQAEGPARAEAGCHVLRGGSGCGERVTPAASDGPGAGGDRAEAVIQVPEDWVASGPSGPSRACVGQNSGPAQAQGGHMAHGLPTRLPS